MHKDYLYRSNEKFAAQVRVLYDTAKKRAFDWGIGDAELAEWEPELLAFEAAFALSENPATRTVVSIKARQSARDALEPKLRRFVQGRLVRNVLVSAADLFSMELPVKDAVASPLPDPSTCPEYKADSGTIRRLILYFRDKGSQRRGKPYGVQGVEIRWAIRDEPPADTEDLMRSEFATRSPHVFEFRESERGKTVYFCMRWQNRRGAKGPFGEIMSAFVP
ncbi:MAG: hypothetical protein LBR08_04990 [Bacteroidales bacterium]|jgi:hypothetical protein|nr:hypothetical protein [Bacteroidales bacterium]